MKTKYPIEWRVAEEDIECYKVLEHYNNKYWTPYCAEKVEFNNGMAMLQDEPLKDIACEKYKEIIERSSSLKGYYIYVGKGMIHTCVNSTHAKNEAYFLTDEHPMVFKYNIYNAVIPKGTEYIVSEDGKEYASRRIKIYR